MARYIPPDDPVKFVYRTTGEARTASPGDFLKCVHCKRYQQLKSKLALNSGSYFRYQCHQCVKIENMDELIDSVNRGFFLSESRASEISDILAKAAGG